MCRQRLPRLPARLPRSRNNQGSREKIDSVPGYWAVRSRLVGEFLDRKIWITFNPDLELGNVTDARSYRRTLRVSERGLIASPLCRVVGMGLLRYDSNCGGRPRRRMTFHLFSLTATACPRCKSTVVERRPRKKFERLLTFLYPHECRSCGLRWYRFRPLFGRVTR